MDTFKIKSKLHRVIEKLSELLWRLKILFRFPHLWTCIIILCIAVIAFFISFYLNNIGQNYWSSILANLFAGLITGFVICLISSIKQTSIIKMKEKKAWLEQIENTTERYLSEYDDLKNMHFDQFYGDKDNSVFIYDVGLHAKWVNEEILQGSLHQTLSFNTIKYCKEMFGYDAHAMYAEYERLLENLSMIDLDFPSSKTIRKYFKNVDSALRKLNFELYTAINDLDIRLSEIQKTII